MGRPRNYFERNQYAVARRSAQERGKKLFLFKRPLRGGKTVSGYYIGTQTPERWKTATFEQKKID